jgi:Fic family protein
VRERGDLQQWFQFFLRGVARQALNAVDSADALLQLRDDFRERLRVAAARGQAVEAAERLIGNPFVTVPQLARELGVTRQGAQYVVTSLQKAGVIEPVASAARPALFVARDVLAVLQRN